MHADKQCPNYEPQALGWQDEQLQALEPPTPKHGQPKIGQPSFRATLGFRVYRALFEAMSSTCRAVNLLLTRLNPKSLAISTPCACIGWAFLEQKGSTSVHSPDSILQRSRRQEDTSLTGLYYVCVYIYTHRCIQTRHTLTHTHTQSSNSQAP